MSASVAFTSCSSFSYSASSRMKPKISGRVGARGGRTSAIMAEGLVSARAAISWSLRDELDRVPAARRAASTLAAESSMKRMASGGDAERGLPPPRRPRRRLAQTKLRRRRTSDSSTAPGGKSSADEGRIVAEAADRNRARATLVTSSQSGRFGGSKTLSSRARASAGVTARPATSEKAAATSSSLTWPTSRRRCRSEAMKARAASAVIRQRRDHGARRAARGRRAAAPRPGRRG